MVKVKDIKVPTGFLWDHSINAYLHEDGRYIDGDSGIMYGKGGNRLTVDEQIVQSGKTAARITPADVDAAIKEEEFIVHGTLTICVLTLNNGFKVIGESACASPENFDAAVGQRVSRDKAKEKIWPLLGYQLRTRLDDPFPHE